MGSLGIRDGSQQNIQLHQKDQPNNRVIPDLDALTVAQTIGFGWLSFGRNHSCNMGLIVKKNIFKILIKLIEK